MRGATALSLLAPVLAAFVAAQNCPPCLDLVENARQGQPNPCPVPKSTSQPDGPGLTKSGDTISTKADGADIELTIGDCTLRTKSGRDKFCGAAFDNDPRETDEGLSLELPANGGCCTAANRCGFLTGGQLIKVGN